MFELDSITGYNRLIFKNLPEFDCKAWSQCFDSLLLSIVNML